MNFFIKISIFELLKNLLMNKKIASVLDAILKNI